MISSASNPFVSSIVGKSVDVVTIITGIKKTATTNEYPSVFA
jgi:hypothetical protein